jgi:hypothetical protein
MQVMRGLSLKKDNWNLFVGDTRYRTTFFMQFIDKSTKTLYERHIMSTTMYSVRCLLAALWVLLIFYLGDEEMGEISKWQAFVSSLITIVSFLGSKNDLGISLRYLNSMRVRQVLLVSVSSFKLCIACAPLLRWSQTCGSHRLDPE